MQSPTLSAEAGIANHSFIAQSSAWSSKHKRQHGCWHHIHLTRFLMNSKLGLALLAIGCAAAVGLSQPARADSFSLGYSSGWHHHHSGYNVSIGLGSPYYGGGYYAPRYYAPAYRPVRSCYYDDIGEYICQRPYAYAYPGYGYGYGYGGGYYAPSFGISYYNGWGGWRGGNGWSGRGGRDWDHDGDGWRGHRGNHWDRPGGWDRGHFHNGNGTDGNDGHGHH
jgi:hypothetical protein